MEVSVHNNPAAIATVVDIDDDSDYGSDFSVGEEQLVEEILAGLESGNAAIVTTKLTSATAISPAGQNHDAEPRAPIPIVLAHPSSHAASLTAPGLTQPLPPANDEGTVTPRIEQCIVSLDPVRYPDCKFTVLNHAQL